MPFLLRLFLCWCAVCASLLVSVATFSSFAYGYSRLLLTGTQDTAGADFLAGLATFLFAVGQLFLAAWATALYGFGWPVTARDVHDVLFGADDEEEEEEVYDLPDEPQDCSTCGAVIPEGGCENCPCHAGSDLDLGSEAHLASLDRELKRLEAENAAEAKPLG